MKVPRNISIDEFLIEMVEAHAQNLSEEYGVPVSFSEVVRRALTAFLLPKRSTDGPMIDQKIEPADCAAASN
jgi:hypothetical protein